MARVVISHMVKDYDTWRPAFDADRPRRKGIGITDEKVYREHGNPNHIYFSGLIEDPTMIKQMMNDPGLADKMAEAGVISEPKFVILDQV